MARMSSVQEKAGETAERASEMAEKGRQVARRGMEAAREKTRHPLWGIPAFYLGFTAAAAIASLTLFFARKDKQTALFVGLWPPTIIGLGLFHKVVVGMEERREEQ